MVNQYPYVPSGGPLIRTIQHLRRSFPREVTADALRKLGAAPSNESYVINVLRLLASLTQRGRRSRRRPALSISTSIRSLRRSSGS
jgi:hypothetical protein